MLAANATTTRTRTAFTKARASLSCAMAWEDMRREKVASQLAVEEVAQFFVHLCREDEFEWPYELDHDRPFNSRALEGAIRYANDRIFVESMKKAELEGMGTTICALAVSDDEMVVAHVGDSRVYRLRDGTLSQITEDHSLINHYRKLGNLTEEELEALGARKNVIVRALGLKDEVEVDVALEDMSPGDVFLVCSDGLTDLVEDPVILETMESHGDDLDGCAEELVHLANEGGKDNITVSSSFVLPAKREESPNGLQRYRTDSVWGWRKRQSHARLSPPQCPLMRSSRESRRRLQSADAIHTDVPPPPLPVQEEDEAGEERLKIVVSSGEVDLLGPTEDTLPDQPLNAAVAEMDPANEEPQSPLPSLEGLETMDPELRALLSTARPSDESEWSDSDSLSLVSPVPEERIDWVRNPPVLPGPPLLSSPVQAIRRIPLDHSPRFLSTSSAPPTESNFPQHRRAGPCRPLRMGNRIERV